MEFIDIGFPAQGGRMDGQSIVCKVCKLDNERVWPAGMWTPEGWFYRLMFDENDLPTHWAAEPSKDKRQIDESQK